MSFRTTSSAAVLALAAGLALAGPASAAPAPYTAPFTVSNLNSGKCLEVADWGTGNGAAVRQWSCHGGDNQKWYWTAAHELVNVHSGKCLDNPGYSTVPGTRPVIWDCNAGTNQKWTEVLAHSGSRYYLNEVSKLALDVAGGSKDDGAPVIQWPMGPSGASYNQIWFPSDFTDGPR
ncbi:RICIN domain-containing protein [Kitasatospora sp. NPDC056184]|uniref:RICIN domain-containing protein n=1 Tax=Kitasatospora sp. NPDC056184 TaxID=3345738 RepID=UPI0035E245EA